MTIVPEAPRTEKKTIDFFITGLPRSRMAWIANYLTYGKMACYFDVFQKGLDGQGPNVIKIFANQSDVVGIADSAALMFQDRMLKDHPGAKWVIIHRPKIDIVRSMKRLNVPVDDRLSTLEYKLGELTLKTPVLRVRFEDINSQIAKIANYVSPGWTCPASRHEMLLGLNIQSTATVDDLNKIPAINPLSEAAEKVKPTKTQEIFFKIVQEICGTNQFAYRWIRQAIACATVMDHIADSDIMDFTHFDQTMKGVLLEWGVNPFYIKYAHMLSPVMANCISAWQHSTGEMKRVKHYDIYTELPLAVAMMLGGSERVDEFSPKLRPIVEQLMKEDNIRDAVS